MKKNQKAATPPHGDIEWGKYMLALAENGMTWTEFVDGINDPRGKLWMPHVTILRIKRSHMIPGNVYGVTSALRKMPNLAVLDLSRDYANTVAPKISRIMPTLYVKYNWCDAHPADYDLFAPFEDSLGMHRAFI